MSQSDDEQLTAATVRLRAVAGARMLALRGLMIRGISFVGGLIIARMLVPADLGTVVIGSTVLSFGMLIADGGAGAWLIRRTAPPRPIELASLQGWQVTVSTVLVVAVACFAPFFGRTGMVAAIMLASLPLVSLRTPAAILLERRLLFGRLVLVELAEILTWLVVGVSLVAAGLSVWGLAIATVIRSGVGTVSAIALCQTRVTPRLSLRAIRELVRFGAKFQGMTAVNLVRDQGINLIVLGLGGLPALGIWALAFRLMQLPYLVLESLWRVSFPAVSRLIETGTEMAPLIKRVLYLVTVGNGFLLVALASAAPRLVEVLFGPQWQGAEAAIPPACAGLLLSGGVSVCAAGLLLAEDRAGVVLKASVLHTLAWLGTTAALWPVTDVGAVGWGWLVSCIVDVLVLGKALQLSLGISVIGTIWVPVVSALGSAAIGMMVTLTSRDALIGVAWGTTTGTICFATCVGFKTRSSFKALRNAPPY